MIIGQQFTAIDEFEGSFEFPPGTPRVSVYVPGLTYTIRSDGLATAVERWAAEGRITLLGMDPGTGLRGT